MFYHLFKASVSINLDIFRDKKMVHALQYKYTKGLAEWSFLDPNWLVLMRNQLQ